MAFLDGVLNFLKLTHEAHRVERVARIPGEKRYATMVEHSWQLAMLAWYIIDTQKLPLDKDLVLRYALCHDLVETYAGDTYSYDTDTHLSKGEREARALEKIASENGEFSEMLTTMRAYERREDEESKFLYALDKMIDPLNIYLEGGLLHQEKQVAFATYRAYKEPKVSAHPFVFEHIYAELTKRFAADESTYFFIKKSTE